MSIRNYSNTAAQSTLTANIGATDTSIVLANYAGDPTPPFTAALARGTATEEIVLVTAVIGSTVTVTRGYDGTQAQAQTAGTTFQEVVVAQDFREANNHVNATGAVHGAASQIVGVSDTQTLTNKTLTAPQVTNLTGTGTTTLAAVTATTMAVSGASTFASAQVTANPAAAADVVRKDYVDNTAGTFNADPSSLVRRDSSGNISFGAVSLGPQPNVANTAVRKDYADGLGVSAATPSTIVRRDSAGRTQVADPAAAADAASKNYVDHVKTQVYQAPAYTGNSSTNTQMPITSVTYPDPGVPHVLLIDAIQYALVSPGSVWNLVARVDGPTGAVVRPTGNAQSTTYAPVVITGGSTIQLTGGHTVNFYAERITPSGNAGDGYQPNPTANLQAYRVQVVPV